MDNIQENIGIMMNASILESLKSHDFDMQMSLCGNIDIIRRLVYNFIRDSKETL